MVALFGLPGGQCFSYKLVDTHAEGQAWLEEFRDELGEDQATLQAYRQSEIVSNKVAASMRYLDSSRVVPEVGPRNSRDGTENWSYNNVDI